MVFNYGKIIIDNRDNVQPFYDGLSMGCGEIHYIVMEKQMVYQNIIMIMERFQSISINSKD